MPNWTRKEEERAVALRKRNLSCRAIADFLGRSVRSVQGRLLALGYPAHRSRGELAREVAARAGGLWTDAELAREYRCNRSQITKARHQAGVPTLAKRKRAHVGI